jgi:tetratricopeptide (TPR) repeat protein
MASPELILSIAQRHCDAKRYTEATMLYHQVLEQSPGHPEASHQLGKVLLAQGATEQALQLLGKLSSAQPDQPHVLASLGDAYSRAGRLDDAFTCLSRAAFLMPDNAHVVYLLGRLMLQQQKYESAVGYLRAAVHEDEQIIDAWLRLGVANVHLDNWDEALENFTAVTKLEPDNWEGFSQLGMVHQLLGNRAAARESQETALLLNPENPVVLQRLADLLCLMDEWEEALSLQQKRSAMMPADRKIQLDIAISLYHLGRLKEAETACYRMISEDASNWDASLLLGRIQYRQGNMDAAQTTFETLVTHVPDKADAYLALSHLYLAQEQHRLARPAIESYIQLLPPRFETPTWDGTHLTGKKLFIYSAFNSFDTLLFMGYIAVLASQGVQTIVECPSILADVVSTIDGVDAVWTGEGPISFDTHCPVELLYARAELSSPIPAVHFSVEENLISQKARMVPSRDGLRVGLMWRHEEDRNFQKHRSVPLQSLVPILDVPGIVPICVQYQTGLEEITGTAFEDVLVVPDTPPENLMDTLALIRTLDVFICADTLLAQLAANTDIPVWMMLPQHGEWFWTAIKNATPWCTNAALFRQSQAGDWTDVVTGITAALQRRVASPDTQNSIRTTRSMGELEG